MIKISPNISNRNYMNLNKHVSFSGTDVSELLKQGDSLLNSDKASDAIAVYNQALKMDPDNVSINRKLGKANFHLKNYAESEAHYKKYVEQNQQNAEAWIDLGEAQRQNGFYKAAKESFEIALQLEPDNNLAKRSILETENNFISCFSPLDAYEAKNRYAQQNLQKALQMTVDYMTPEFMQGLSNVQIKFGETASMGGTSNIAQYENGIKTITISNAYKYAAPQVIAAYLVHESVHAKDADAYTSIREEQDAYEVATKFWIQNSNGVKDPEMDYAADLYKKSPDALKNRVEEIYLMRDPDIAKTSPNHPPQKKFHFVKNSSKAADQPIKEYSAIA